MKTALIFARMDSRRLPGKALANLAGRPMLARVVDRVTCAETIGDIVVATSDRSVDDPIAVLAEEIEVPVFRGAADDVAGRALACCAERGLAAFVRISGDSPFVAPEVIDRIVEMYDAETPDLATNVHPRSFPPGCSVEVIGTDVLDRAARAMDTADREHVTAHFYRNADAYRIANLRAEGEVGGVRLTVDTEDELARARWIVASAAPEPERRGLDEIVAMARAYDATKAGAAP